MTYVLQNGLAKGENSAGDFACSANLVQGLGARMALGTRLLLQLESWGLGLTAESWRLGSQCDFGDCVISKCILKMLLAN